MIRQQIFIKIIYILLFYVLLNALLTIPVLAENNTIIIGVLLPLTGPDVSQLLHGLSLGVDQINEGGGIGGKPVTLLLRDTASGDIKTYAQDLINDPRIQVVIGPYSSDETFQIADDFVANKLVLVTPTASSDEIFRAYSNTGSIWQTITNDGKITSVMMQHMKLHNTQSIALLTPNSSYGKTFYDWIPFWAIETGISVYGIEEYASQQEIPNKVKNLIASNPDYLIFIHTGLNEEIDLVIQTLKKLNCPTKLYLVYPEIDDQGQLLKRIDSSSLIGSVMSGQWKLTTTSASIINLPENTLLIMGGKPDLSFIMEFEKKFDERPSGYAAQAYDSVLVSAEILARFMNNPKKSPQNAAQSILLNQTGEPLPRTIQGFQEAIFRIKKGESPIMTGATGPLTYNSKGTERATPWYGIYCISNGKVIDETLQYQDLTKSKEKSNINLSKERSPSEKMNQSSGDFWAVIGALSKDWKNYRHQADALTIYQYIKSQGVPDDHIILLIYDDILTDNQNEKKGEVYHEPGTYEVRKGASPDYTGDQVSKQTLLNILSGSRVSENSPVLASDANSTVLLYLSSHGIPGGTLLFRDGNESMSSYEFSSIIEKMANEKKFSQMLIILESCFSGATFAGVTTKNVTILTASASEETSKSAIYDSELGVWLSDEFTNELISLLQRKKTDATISSLYQELYQNVRSSHPSMKRDSFSQDYPSQMFFGWGVL